MLVCAGPAIHLAAWASTCGDNFQKLARQICFFKTNHCALCLPAVLQQAPCLHTHTRISSLSSPGLSLGGNPHSLKCCCHLQMGAIQRAMLRMGSPRLWLGGSYSQGKTPGEGETPGQWTSGPSHHFFRPWKVVVGPMAGRPRAAAMGWAAHQAQPRRAQARAAQGGMLLPGLGSECEC